MQTIDFVVMPAKGYIHPGQVICYSLLKMLFPSVKPYWVKDECLEELRDFDRDSSLFLYINGWGGKFDPKNFKERSNGIKYSAPGIIWQEYGKEIVDSYDIRKKIENYIISPMDNYDNKGLMCQIAWYIKSFNILVDNKIKSTKTTAFIEAVNFMTEYLVQIIEAEKLFEREKKITEKAYLDSDDEIICLPCYVRWHTVLIDKEKATFVVYPSKERGYTARCIPKEYGSIDSKKEFPEDWYNEPEKFGFVKANREKKFVMADSKEILIHNLSNLLEYE